MRGPSVKTIEDPRFELFGAEGVATIGLIHVTCMGSRAPATATWYVSRGRPVGSSTTTTVISTIMGCRYGDFVGRPVQVMRLAEVAPGPELVDATQGEVRKLEPNPSARMKNYTSGVWGMDIGPVHRRRMGFIAPEGLSTAALQGAYAEVVAGAPDFDFPA